MSVILAILGPDTGPRTDERILDRMLDREVCPHNADEYRVRTPTAVLAARRERWLAGPLGMLAAAEVDGLHCVLDGCLYYRGQLRDQLEAAGCAIPRDAPHADFALAAYGVWGPAAANRLEGDYSLVVWDGRRQRAFLARSYPGPFPLVFSWLGERLLVSSSVSALLEHPEVSPEPNLVTVVECAAGLLFEPHPETGYRDVQRLHGGWSSEWTPGAPPTLRAHWRPTPTPSSHSRAEAAEELRARLTAAVSERTDAEGPTSVWLSGGFDSSAVFGAAMNTGAPESYSAVSISYPDGDIGREDEFIHQIAGAWDRPVRWLDIDQIPPRTDLERHAAGRGDPFVHAFDTWNAALAVASRQDGARVALGGDGGDQLFQAPPLHLVDLFWSGRLFPFLKQWRSMGGRHLRSAVAWTLRTGFPDGLRPLAARLRRGRVPVDPLAAQIPDWISSTFMERHGLRERAHVSRPRGLRSQLADFEFQRVLASPFFSRTTESVAGEALRCGVVQRSPLWDRRVVELALSRPAHERMGGGETKHLLRAASSGLIPEAVLAPRPQRTGTPDRFFHRLMRERYEPLFGLLTRDSILVEAGAVRAAELKRAIERYLQQRQFFLGAQLSFTFEAELWLRARA